MPFLSHITSTFFTNLINRLGVRPPPPDGFDLINTVQPVSIVDSDITLNAISSTIVLGTPFTAGPLAIATAANTVHADTGAQAAGTYAVLIVAGYDRTAGTFTTLLLQRRDAANAANIWEQQIDIGVNSQGFAVIPLSITLNLNERLRILNKQITTLTTQQASIWIQQIS